MNLCRYLDLKGRNFKQENETNPAKKQNMKNTGKKEEKKT